MKHYSKYILVVIFLSHSLISFAQQEDELLFKFGVMADPQYCDCENKEGSRKYKLSLQKLPEAINTFNQENLEFVVNLGDFIDRDWESYQPLKEITKNLEVPLYHVVGNHDYEVEDQYKDQVPSMLGLENRYYDFKKQNWRFVALDGTNVSLYGTPKNSRKHKRAEKMLEKLKKKNLANAQNWNGAVGKNKCNGLKRFCGNPKGIMKK